MSWFVSSYQNYLLAVAKEQVTVNLLISLSLSSVLFWPPTVLWPGWSHLIHGSPFLSLYKIFETILRVSIIIPFSSFTSHSSSLVFCFCPLSSQVFILTEFVFVYNNQTWSLWLDVMACLTLRGPKYLILFLD